MKKEKMLKSDFILDICISLLLTFKIVNYSLVTIFKSTEKGFLGTLFFVVGIISTIVLLYLFFKNIFSKRTVKIPVYGLSMVLIVSLLYVLSYERTSLSLYEFYVYFLLSFLLAIRKSININRVLTFIMVISLISLFCFEQLFMVQWYGSVDMDISYAFLPTVVAFIVHYSFFYKQAIHKKLYLLLYLININFLLKLFLYGERGTLLCILLTILLCWIFKYNSEGKLEVRKISLRMVITMFLSFMVLLFYKEILTFVVYITNINSYAINKYLTLSSTDVSNGRFDIYKMAFEGFLNHPILGNGISSFKNNTGIIYVHNLFVQLLYDGGLLLFIPFMYIFIVGTKRVFVRNYNNLIPFWIYLFPTSIVYLCFSNDIWYITSIWVFIGFLSINIKNSEK